MPFGSRLAAAAVGILFEVFTLSGGRRSEREVVPVGGFNGLTVLVARHSSEADDLCTMDAVAGAAASMTGKSICMQVSGEV